MIETCEQLGQRAAERLAQNGIAAIMVGQHWMLTAGNILQKYVEYSWDIDLPVVNDDVPVPSGQVFVGHKIILVFRKKDTPYVGPAFKDTVYGCGKDKRFHFWGMPIGEMMQVIEKFTAPGQLVLDPCVGGGTTAIAALLLKRIFFGIDCKQKWIDISKARVAQFFKEYPDALGVEFSPWWMQPPDPHRKPHKEKDWYTFWITTLPGAAPDMKVTFQLTVTPTQLSDFLRIFRNRWQGENITVEFRDRDGLFLLNWPVGYMTQAQLDKLASTLLEVAKANDAHLQVPQY